MTNPSAKKQLANIWQGVVDDLMEMTESEIDAELRELGIEPKVAEEQGRLAVEEALRADRARQRGALRKQVEAARDRPTVTRDPTITAEHARQHITRLQAANDGMLTLAARNRSPDELSDQEALDLFWSLQDLRH